MNIMKRSRQTKTAHILPKNSKIITICLVLILIALLGIVFYWSMPFIKRTDIYKNYQDSRFIYYKSARAKLSFQYPYSWPMAVIPEERLKSDNLYRIKMKAKGISQDAPITIENIDFQEEWIPNAGAPRYGWIDVKKIEGVNSLDDYIKLINKEAEIYCPRNSKGVCIIPAPEIKDTTIGGERAISLKDDEMIPSLSRNLAEFVVVKNGWVYRFAADYNQRFWEDKDANWAKFQKIIESIRFTD